MAKISALQVLLWLPGVLFYFLPAIVSFAKKRPNRVSILLVNLALGWTVLGWLLALAWALSKPTAVMRQSMMG